MLQYTHNYKYFFFFPNCSSGCFVLREIGVVASYSRSFEAPILVYKGVEGFVKEESLAVIEDIKFKRMYLGVLRSTVKLDPLLTTSYRSAVIEKPELAEGGLDIPYETVYVKIIGEFTGNRIEPATTPPTPRSKVYLIESPRDLNLDLGSGLVIGVHKYSGVELPFKSEALRYHVAVVGTTGTGKSRLVKALVDEVLAKTNMSVLVFDHTGMDYTPYWPDKTVRADEIVLDVETITEGLKLAVGAVEKLIEDYVPIALMEYIICESGRRDLCEQWRNFIKYQKNLPDISREEIEKLTINVSSSRAWNPSKLAGYVNNTAMYFGAKPATRLKLPLYITLFAGHYIERLNSMRYSVDELVEKLHRDKLLVVDLSTVETETRRVIVKRFLERFLGDYY